MTIHITYFEIDAKGDGRAEFSDGDVIEFLGLTNPNGFVKLEDAVNHHKELLIMERIKETRNGNRTDN